MDILMSILVLIVLIVLLCIIPFMAKKRGRSELGWFILSLFTSPILGIILLAILGESDEKRRQRIIEEEELRQRVAQRHDFDLYAQQRERNHV